MTNIARHISLFMPSDSAFHRRIFNFFRKGFAKRGWTVSGACRLLPDSEMRSWVLDNKPDFIFEMNRVKAEIPVLFELQIPHLTWLVDMQGRGESQIKGSEITYFIDPGWEFNFDTGGHTAWMPPGACLETFYPLRRQSRGMEFGFIGHIPKPWAREELDRTLSSGTASISFERLLAEYTQYMDIHTYFGQTHETCIGIIDSIVQSMLGCPVKLPNDIYYDLLIRAKRVSNRTDLMNFALNRSASISIYGSENWKGWEKYSAFYKGFVDDEQVLNRIHSDCAINLHDGISFHFRSIDCMASGGLLLWYNTNDGDKFNIYRDTLSKNGPGNILGLSNFFEPQRHYYEFTWQDFDEVYDEIRRIDYIGSKAMHETIDIIKANHTWDKRVASIISDINRL